MMAREARAKRNDMAIVVNSLSMTCIIPAESGIMAVIIIDAKKLQRANFLHKLNISCFIRYKISEKKNTGTKIIKYKVIPSYLSLQIQSFVLQYNSVPLVNAIIVPTDDSASTFFFVIHVSISFEIKN